MKNKIISTLLAFCLLASLALPAYALEYTFDEDEQSGYGKPTSVETVVTADGGAQKNEDVSKNAALIPPAFGSAASNTLNTGKYLTPNLAPQAMAGTGGLVNGNVTIVFPPDLSGLSAESVPADSATGTAAFPGSAGSTFVPGSAEVTVTVPEAVSSGYTEVTDDMHYKDGSLGMLEIPAIGLSVNIFEGTDAATLKRITLATKLGTRTYEVTSVSKVSETDRSALAASQSNIITLYTCVQNERDLRWCVTGTEIV